MTVRVYSLLAIASLACAIGSPAGAQQSEADIAGVLQTGVQQFERGELDAALASFESALGRDPDNAFATYEIALTYYQKGEQERALEILDDAFARDIAEGAEFYALAASIVDNLGRPDEALERFEDGIAAYPDHHGLHLNLGITQMRLGQTEQGKATFERAVALQPEHPSAHAYLGRIYASEGQNAAAILALGTSIGFDANAQRRASSAGVIMQIMDSTVSQSDDGTTVVVVDVSSGLPVDSMRRLSTRIPLIFASLETAVRKSGGDISYEPYALAFGSLVGTFIDAGIDPASHFAAGHYAGFFGPMVENGHQATFAHLILAPLNGEAARTWIEANGDAYQAFREWTSSRQAQ